MECFRYVKDTNLRAIHNGGNQTTADKVGVFDISKIQIQKQITTLKVKEINKSHHFEGFPEVVAFVILFLRCRFRRRGRGGGGRCP